MQSIINFIMGHQVILAGLVVAIMDFVMALVPSVEANGIFHAVYLFMKKIVNPNG